MSDAGEMDEFCEAMHRAATGAAELAAAVNGADFFESEEEEFLRLIGRGNVIRYGGHR